MKWTTDDILNAVAKRAAATGQPVYLVGGAVRDRLLGQPVHDLDFVLSSPTLPIAKRLADDLRGGLYVMDAERDITRVVIIDGDDRFILDFSALRGSDLDADLRARDFSINAMALDVQQPENLIDPCGGAMDLQKKRLRACGPSSMSDDPARVLRAVRLGVSLTARIDPQTVQWMRAAVSLLARVSAERQRDELFKMLDGPRPAVAVEIADQLGILDMVLPELRAMKGVTQSPPHVHEVWPHTLEVVKRLDQLWGALVGSYREGSAEGLALASATTWLGRYREQFAHHFANILVPDRSIRAVMMLAALYHDAAKPESRSVEDSGRIRFLGHDDRGAEIAGQRARLLALSGDEVSRLQTLVAGHMRIHLLADQPEPPTRRAIYRYFKSLGDAGIDLCLFSLADTWATYSHTLPQERWLAELKVCRALLEARWERAAEVVQPPRLLSGAEVMRELRAAPGPMVGRALEAVREAQAEGLVNTLDEALVFLRQWRDGEGEVN